MRSNINPPTNQNQPHLQNGSESAKSMSYFFIYIYFLTVLFPTPFSLQITAFPNTNEAINRDISQVWPLLATEMSTS